MLTMLDDGPSVLVAIRAGVRGYLVKGAALPGMRIWAKERAWISSPWV